MEDGQRTPSHRQNEPATQADSMTDLEDRNPLGNILNVLKQQFTDRRSYSNTSLDNYERTLVSLLNKLSLTPPEKLSEKNNAVINNIIAQIKFENITNETTWKIILPT